MVGMHMGEEEDHAAAPPFIHRKQSLCQHVSGSPSSPSCSQLHYTISTELLTDAYNLHRIAHDAYNLHRIAHTRIQSAQNRSQIHPACIQPSQNRSQVHAICTKLLKDACHPAQIRIQFTVHTDALQSSQNCSQMHATCFLHDNIVSSITSS